MIIRGNRIKAAALAISLMSLSLSPFCLAASADGETENPAAKLTRAEIMVTLTEYQRCESIPNVKLVQASSAQAASKNALVLDRKRMIECDLVVLATGQHATIPTVLKTSYERRYQGQLEIDAQMRIGTAPAFAAGQLATARFGSNASVMFGMRMIAGSVARGVRDLLDK